MIIWSDHLMILITWLQGAGTPQSYTQGPYQTEEPVEQYFNYQQNIKMPFIFQLSTQYQNFDHISLINTKISIMMSISRLSSQQYDQSMTCQCQHQVPNIYNNNIINRDYPVEDASGVQKKLQHCQSYIVTPILRS